MKKTILTILLIVSVLACKKNVKKTETSKTTQEVIEMTPALTIVLNPKSESAVTGTAKFVEIDGVVKMTAKIKGL